MTKRIITFALLTGATLILAGCGAQTSKQASSASSSSLIAKKSSTKVSADNAGPKHSVALVTAYAGNKYGSDWAQTAKSAESKGLSVNLYQSDKYQLQNGGQGVAYNVTTNVQSSKLVYTLKGNNVIIYQDADGTGAKKLGTVSRQQMVDYINQNGQGQLVNKLADNAQIVDKTNGALTNNASAGTKQASGKYGNQGTFNLPSNMQGTWYSDDKDADGKTLTINGNQIKSAGSTLNLYKRDRNYDVDGASQEAEDATQDWGAATSFHRDGLHWINVRGWFQGAGDGEYYTVTTETVDGHQLTVLAVAGGAGIWTNAVYYQTPTLAQKYKNTKYTNLHYQDDDD